jgi:hypothetical protein
LTPQYQAPQIAHAVADFATAYPAEYREWHRKSNSLICLATKNERELYEFANKLEVKGEKITRFVEPDMGYALTAIAIAPGPNTRKLCSNLPLAGKVLSNAQEVTDRQQKIRNTVYAMQECYQFESQNILEHGLSVRDYAFDLLGHLRYNTPLQREWKLPSWIYEHKDFILRSIVDDYILEKYLIWHDCGKPACRTVDEEGRQHFPNHETASYETWLSISDDHKIAGLIRDDMLSHRLKADSLQSFAANPNWATLLLSGLCEISSNSSMFGGLESIGFKMKFKNFERFGKRLMENVK